MLFVVFAQKARAQEPLKLVATTPMPGYEGDFDHFGVDSACGIIRSRNNVDNFTVKAARRKLSPEFMNRTDKVIVFRTSQRGHQINRGWVAVKPARWESEDRRPNKRMLRGF
jgi:hypothetical protein